LAQGQPAPQRQAGCSAEKTLNRLPARTSPILHSAEADPQERLLTKAPIHIEVAIEAEDLRHIQPFREGHQREIGEITWKVCIALVELSDAGVILRQQMDGRWIAEVPEIPGALAYGSTPSEAMARAEVLAVSISIGWNIKRQTGLDRILHREGFTDVVFAFHDRDEIGPRMLARLAKITGLKPQDF
jgi:predicted RNA binding protein YcfA (HicA-like mRNA interferase family)